MSTLRRASGGDSMIDFGDEAGVHEGLYAAGALWMRIRRESLRPGRWVTPDVETASMYREYRPDMGSGYAMHQ